MTTMPPPAPGEKTAHDRLGDIFVHVLEGYKYLDALELRDDVNKLSLKTVSLILETLKKDASRENEIFELFCSYNRDEPLLREMIVYRPVFDRDTVMSFSSMVIKELSRYGLSKGEDHTEVSEGTAEDIRALLKITEHLYYGSGNNWNPNLTWVHDNELVRLVFRSPSRLDEIVAAVAQRKVDDGNVIREMLESATPLRNGAL